MDPELKQLEQVCSWDDHPYWKFAPIGAVVHEDVFKQMGFTWGAEPSCRVLHYIALSGSDVFHQLYMQYDPLVWACVVEFLHQYLDEQALVAQVVYDEGLTIMTHFNQALSEIKGDFDYAVRRSHHAIGYFHLCDLLSFFDSKIPSRLKCLLSTDKPRFGSDLVHSPGARPDIIKLLELYDDTTTPNNTNGSFTLEDVLTVFRLPYYKSTIDWFDYSDCVTPLIYAASLGYASVVIELATYYGRDALILECEDNTRYDGYRVALVNLVCSKPAAAQELMHIYKISQHTCDELMSIFGPHTTDTQAVS